MNGFKRALLGYRRTEVEDAISVRDAHILGLELKNDAHGKAIAELEGETTTFSGMVLEREREIRLLDERLREANECHDRSIASLDAITARLEELEAQARGQATRIRMKALREAVEVSKKVKALTDVEAEEAEADSPPRPTRACRPDGSSSRSARSATSRSSSASRTQSARSAPRRSRSSASPRAVPPSR